MVEIIGSGGGKSGSSYRSPVEAPNTLQSSAEVTIVEALSTGPIVGLVNGEKDIY
jgi:predicted phage tail protein